MTNYQNKFFYADSAILVDVFVNFVQTFYLSRPQTKEDNNSILKFSENINFISVFL